MYALYVQGGQEEVVEQEDDDEEEEEGNCSEFDWKLGLLCVASEYVRSLLASNDFVFYCREDDFCFVDGAGCAAHETSVCILF